MSDEQQQLSHPVSAQLTTRQIDPFAVTTLKEAMELGDVIAKSGMFGLKTAAQAVVLMKLAQDEGSNFALLLKKYHVFPDGKISQRADYTQGDFMKNGGHILWHARTESICAATFSLKPFDEKMIKTALDRFKVQWQLEYEENGDKRSEMIAKLAELSIGEDVTIIRTYADAENKGLTKGRDGTKTNWLTSPRQMLHARVITEGIRAIAPGLVAGVYSEDEVEDIRKAEWEATQSKMRADKEARTEKEQIEWMISDKLTQAQADDITKETKSRLLGEAAELRTKLFEKFGASEKPEDSLKTPVVTSGGVDTAPTTPKPDVGGKASQEPTGELSLPGSEVTVLPPEPPRWQDYKLQKVTNKVYRTKTLEELTADEINLLWEKRGGPKLDDSDKLVRTDARMLELAWKELHKHDK